MCCTTELYIFSPKEKCVRSFVCESEMREMKACLHRCTTWTAHNVLFQWHGRTTVSDITFLSEIIELTSGLYIVLRRCDRNACQCAMRESAVKRWVQYGVFCSPAQIVKFSFHITLSVSRSRVAFQVREHESTGLPF